MGAGGPCRAARGRSAMRSWVALPEKGSQPRLPGCRRGQTLRQPGASRTAEMPDPGHLTTTWVLPAEVSGGVNVREKLGECFLLERCL
jgi:hypothetical protein